MATGTLLLLAVAALGKVARLAATGSLVRLALLVLLAGSRRGSAARLVARSIRAVCILAAATATTAATAAAEEGLALALLLASRLLNLLLGSERRIEWDGGGGWSWTWRRCRHRCSHLHLLGNVRRDLRHKRGLRHGRREARCTHRHGVRERRVRHEHLVQLDLELVLGRQLVVVGLDGLDGLDRLDGLLDKRHGIGALWLRMDAARLDGCTRQQQQHQAEGQGTRDEACVCVCGIFRYQACCNHWVSSRLIV
ncbi:hypothetical protein BC831DRAFT_263582 [Entophlyctis helioformis]|nr:hypothetical protein BC831DRAFT_263582 [Entophlyctis helioformis]